MDIKQFKKTNIPTNPGVYLFEKNRHPGQIKSQFDGAGILYIGKATSLKDRVKSYFSDDLIVTRGPLIVDMVFQADDIDFVETDSVLEALILESNLIKKYQPKYNTKEKDDRSYNYVVITKEEFPRVLIERGRNLENKHSNILQNVGISKVYGPFVNGGQLKEAIKIVRKIFPFRDYCKVYLEASLPSKKKACFNYQIGLCPGTCIGAISKTDYKKNIKNISLFFEGKKKSILKNLEKEMKVFAKKHEFEKADKVKRTIFALNHIQDIALIKKETLDEISRESASIPRPFRIEAYDVAHISGTNTVGVMVVVDGSTSSIGLGTGSSPHEMAVNKSEYRKFSVRGGFALGGKTVLENNKPNDVASLEEVLRRRFNHPEWNFPNIIVVDGSTAQKNVAEKVVKEVKGQLGHPMSKWDVAVVAVTKDERHRPKMITGREDLVHKYEDEILIANSEAHRFAIKYHRESRGKRFMN